MSAKEPKVILDIERAFSWNEHAERIAVARKKMFELKLDALLVTSRASIYYLFGIQRWAGAGIFGGVLLPLDKEPVAIVFVDNDIMFQQSPLFGEVITWDKDHSFAVEEIGRAVRRLGITPRIGIEVDDDSVSPAMQSLITEKLREVRAQSVISSSLITHLRIIKSPAEIQCMRKAAQLLDKHFLAAFAAIKPGVRECDVAGAAVHASYLAGADTCIHPPLITSGVNTLLRTYNHPSRRELQRGDVVGLESGANFQGYHAVGCHTLMVGSDPTAEQQRYYASVRAQIDTALDLIGPGASYLKISTAITDVASEHRTPRGVVCDLYSVGIGAGNFWFEDIPINSQSVASDWILQPGTTTVVFGAAEKRGEYLILCADLVLITDRGYEVLTQLDRSELRVLG